MLSKESVKWQEEIWYIVREQIRNNYSTGAGDDSTNQSVKMDNGCICVAPKKP